MWSRIERRVTRLAGYESVDLGGDIPDDLNHQRWPIGDGEIGVFRAHEALSTATQSHRCLTAESSRRHHRFG